MTITSHPMAKATMAAVALATTSNILAQVLEAWQQDKHIMTHSPDPKNPSFQLDFAQILRFAFVVFLTTPPNYLWQAYLERTFPAYGPSRGWGRGSVPASTALKDAKERRSHDADGMFRDVERGQHHNVVAGGSYSDDDDETIAPGGTTTTTTTTTTIPAAISAPGAGPQKPVKPRLNWRNTMTKWFIDCITLGALMNTVAFFVLMGLLKRHPVSEILQSIRTETIPLILAGYRVWPFASIISFTCIPVEKRVVFLNFVGLLWGIYMSFVASRV